MSYVSKVVREKKQKRYWVCKNIYFAYMMAETIISLEIQYYGLKWMELIRMDRNLDHGGIGGDLYRLTNGVMV